MVNFINKLPANTTEILVAALNDQKIHPKHDFPQPIHFSSRTALARSYRLPQPSYSHFRT